MESYSDDLSNSKRERELSKGGPELFIYFAKSEEAAHLDAVSVGLDGGTLHSFGGIPATVYTHQGIEIGVIAGSQQGSGFYYDFVNFTSRVRPVGVIMCGICAGLGDCNPGDVMVGTSSVLMQGKLERLDVSGLDMDFCDPANTTADASLWADLGATVHIGTYLQSPFVLGFSLDIFKDRLQPAYRKLVGIDMESWFYLNSQKRQEVIFPVVKGVSDKGAKKTDEHHKLAVNNSVRIEHHKLAVNNSVRIALQMLQRFNRLRLAEPLPTMGHPSRRLIQSQNDARSQIRLLSPEIKQELLWSLGSLTRFCETKI
jgi:nucleoside phosphorylase